MGTGGTEAFGLSIALMQTLWSVQPTANDSRALMLTAFAASGDENGVRRVIEADPGSVNELGLDGTSPLCAAAMWGHVNILKTLLDSMASPALRNENGPQWTPLHAAALQEEGKACMLLMEGRANPLEKDTEGITPCDYASVSEAVWPLFAARGCDRQSKSELIQKGVLRKASSTLEKQLEREALEGPTRRGVVFEYSRPGSSYVVSREFPPRPGSQMGGRLPTASRQSRPIDILEEEPQAEELANGLRSLGM